MGLGELIAPYSRSSAHDYNNDDDYNYNYRLHYNYIIRLIILII